MFYFIPAWYGQDRVWHFDLTNWYFMNQQLNFDDTVHQIRMFRTKQEVKILHLNYHPHLRHFLHQQDIFEVEVSSVFDDIQQVEKWQSRKAEISDFNWPEDCQFYYNPFNIRVDSQNALLAKIEMGLEGYISHINFYQQDLICETYLIDDRGFVSSVIYYENGTRLYQEYLTPQGDWVMRESLQESDYVLINPEFSSKFKQLNYLSMADIVKEIAETYLAQIKSDDTLVIASSQHHNSLLAPMIPHKCPLVQTFYTNRNIDLNVFDFSPIMERTDLVVVDTKAIQKKIISLFPEKKGKIHHLPSFDTRLNLGMSQSKKISKVFYQINFNEIIDEYALFKILQIVSEDKNLELVISMYNGDSGKIEEIQLLVESLIDDYLDRTAFISLKQGDTLEDLLQDDMVSDKIEYRFKVKNITSDLELIQELEYTRLIIDLSKEPNLYTQIAGISAGIPQINMIQTEYVENKKNGLIIKEVPDLPSSVHYYVDTLKHWNESLIHSIHKIKKFTGDEILKKWNQLLKE